MLTIDGILDEGGYDACDIEDLGEDIRYLVNKGILEQHTGEDGRFYFSLTDIGTKIAEDMHRSGNDSSMPDW